MAAVDVAVAEDDVVHPLIHRCLGSMAEVVESLTKTACTPPDIEEHSQLARLETLVTDIAEDVKLAVCQHGPRQAHHLAVGSVGGQDIFPHGTDVLRQAHHQLLADGVDSRVGHLGKLLTEVVEQHLRTVANDSQRGVVTHGSHRFLPCRSHGDKGSVDVFLSEAEGDELAPEVVHPVLHMAAAVQLLQLDAVLLEPFAVGMGFGETFLDVAVVVDAPFLSIDEQDFPRLQASLAHHVERVEVHHTHLAGYHNHAAAGDGIAAGTQAVAVKHASGVATVGKQQRSRAVPRLHQDGVIFVEGFQVVTDRIFVIEALRHQNGQRLRQAQPAHHKEFEDVVQTGRVAHALLHDGTDVADVAQGGAAEHTLACLHPTTVATDGVDLAVVRQQPEGLCQLPLGECVCREARMYQRQSACEPGTRQVGEVAAQLSRSEHTFVDDVSA